MQKLLNLRSPIFNIHSKEQFDEIALESFRFQSSANPVYKNYLSLLKINPSSIQAIDEIPFLPIEFFKSHQVVTELQTPNSELQTFTSSGTTGTQTSKHYVADVSLYEESFLKCFELFYGSVKDYCVIALLPSYLEREGSSLVYMMNKLIALSGHPKSGFYLHNHDELYSTLIYLKEQKQKTSLIGVTYALLDFIEKYQMDFPELMVVETGGTKGKRQEMVREELHSILKKGFGVKSIHSEYGMTELLSQAYSKGEGIFHTPPWMKIIIHQNNDPLQTASVNQTGLISIIDLANIYSCSFITTHDLGKLHEDGSFEVLGRADFSDVRGCNLIIE